MSPQQVWGDYYLWETPEKFSEQSYKVGTSSCRFLESKAQRESLFWTRACELDGTLREFAWPDRTSEAEKKSFRLQADKHVIERHRPTFEDIVESNTRVLPKYLRHQLPTFWKKFSYESIKEGVQEYQYYVKGDSSPGVPYSFTAGRNDKLINILGERFCDLVWSRMAARLKYTLEEVSLMTRQELLDKNLMDPVRVFVKGEPHKVKKIQEGRVRLIMSVSIVDKMVEMLCIRHLTKLEIRNWKTLPSKPGIGFTKEDVRSVYDDVMSSLPMSATDISGWDWSVDDWQIFDEAEGVITLCDNPTEEWKHIVRVTAIVECNSIYCFSDGTLVVPIFSGIVNSGKFKTSRGNSFMRVRLADLVGSEKCIANGDDSVETTIEEAKGKYAKYGFEIREYEPVVDSFEFCSRVYKDGVSYPVKYQKIVMNLLHNIPSTALEFRMFITGFIDDLEYHPQFTEIMANIERVGYFELVGAQEVLDE